MAFTDEQMNFMETTTVSREGLGKVGLDKSYYLSPLMYIEDSVNMKLQCSIQDYRFAVEMAHDEDVCPEDASLPVIVDGILAYVCADELEKCGLDLTTYFTYRFFPPSQEFQNKLDEFETLMREAL